MIKKLSLTLTLIRDSKNLNALKSEELLKLSEETKRNRKRKERLITEYGETTQKKNKLSHT